MTSSALDSLSRDDLIEIIQGLVSQKEELEQSHKKEIGELHKSYKKQIRELQSKIEELTRASKRQAAPFRREEKKLNKKKKRSGRKSGHKGHYWKFTGKPDRIIDEKLSKCPGCGHDTFENVEATEQYVQDCQTA